MQDAHANTLDFHLPERWTVLEQALRQMHAEQTDPGGGFREDDGPAEAEAPRHARIR